MQAHKKLLEIFPDLLLIIVPRHPEYVFQVQNIAKEIGLSYIIKSNSFVSIQSIQVVINSTVGELMLLYGISDVAFVGGSLVEHGGHNPLEPAAYAIPVLMGPYTFNFHDICVKLNELGGLITVTDVYSIVKMISILFQDKQIRLKYGLRAVEVFKGNQGSLRQLLFLLEKII